MKNILLLLANLGLGGQERIGINTAQILKDDYNVSIAIFDDKDTVYHAECEIINLNIPAKKGKILKAINVIRRVLALNRLIREKRIDIVYSFGTTANYVNALSIRKKLSVISIHGYKSASVSRIERIIYNRADRVICVSEKISETLSDNAPELKNRISTLYNPYYIEEILKKGEEPVADYAFTSKVIVAHGRLNRIKNYPRLIKAFSLIKKDFEDARLLIIGEGEEREKLRLLVDKLELGEYVTLIGFRSNPFAYIAKSDIYVLTSYNEGFPNALVEGMCFLPAVSADCMSGPREILSDGPIDRITKGWETEEYGILVQPAENEEYNEQITDDDRILADAIVELLHCEEMYSELKKRAGKRVTEFSYDVYNKKLIEILK